MGPGSKEDFVRKTPGEKIPGREATAGSLLMLVFLL